MARHLRPEDTKAVIAECHMFMVNRPVWVDCWNRKPQNIAIESLTMWAKIFELLGIQYEPLDSQLLDQTSWILS